MKKLLIALLTFVGIASAQAQSQVTVYGRISEYFDNTKVGSTSVNRITDDLSRIGFKGTEDLGNGLKAFFVLETGFAADAPGATTLGNRTALVGIQNNLGSLSAGRDYHVVGAMLNKYDAFGGFFGSNVSNIHMDQGKRIQNAVFATVEPIKGLTFSIQNGFSEVAGATSIKAGSVGYDVGGFSATLGRMTDVDNNSASTAVGFKQEFVSTGTTVFGLWSDDRVLGINSTGKSIGVNQALANNLVAQASYGTNDNADAYSLGVAYKLSKRTEAGVKYSKVNADNSINDVRIIGVGLTHNF